MVGLIPLFAVHVLSSDIFKEMPGFTARLRWFLNHRPNLASLVSRWAASTEDEHHLLVAAARPPHEAPAAARALDPDEFLSDYGVRSLSRAHAAEPYVFEHDGTRFTVEYVPGESTSRLFGGNSNWRGPIWMPMNYLLIELLYEFHQYYTDDFRVECPTGSGKLLSLREIADELSRRVCGIFLRDAAGRRPVSAMQRLAQEEPQFRDHILFHEYFDGDTGRGLGASHQTGWTGLVALLLHPRQSRRRTQSRNGRRKHARFCRTARIRHSGVARSHTPLKVGARRDA